MSKYDNFSRDELIELLQKQDKELARKKYGLVWDSEKEPEQVVLDCAKKLPILKNIAEKDIKTNDDDYNIMIEGDNYHALQVLNYTHKGKIDVIYIDPPYNTGNKDFIYNDRYVDKEDGYRHSKWLNFMEKRLELAKELLKEKGVIFISIDDNEYANLKLLCDKIFGENNVETYIWCLQDKTEGSFVKTSKNTVRKEHEYIVACFKTEIIKFNKYRAQREFSEGSFSNPDDDPRGEWFSGNMSRNGIKSTTGSKYFTITTPTGKTYTRNWTLTKEEFEEKLKNNEIFFSKNGDGVPRLKIYKDSNNFSIQSSLFTDCHTSITGKNQLKNIFNELVFDFPKPTNLIYRLLEISLKNTNGIILDFFAGTGTTGEAVLNLNKNELSNHSFILCTNNESDIAEKICYPRIKKIIQGYNKKASEEFVDGLGGNLKYFKTDFVANSKNKTQTKISLAKQCSEMLCLKTGIYNLICDENPCFKLFGNNKHNKFLCVYFDFFGNDINDFIHKIKSLNGEKFVFMFSLDENVDKSLFEGIENINIEPIPQKILDVYKKIAKEHIKGDNHD